MKTIFFNLRLQPGLHAALKSEAAANSRSLHSEIIHRIEQGLEAPLVQVRPREYGEFENVKSDVLFRRGRRASDAVRSRVSN